jgi:Ca-activated chloride channel family protein
MMSVEQPPVIDTQPGDRESVLTKDFLQRIPEGRSYQSAVQMAPGVTGRSQPNVGGASSPNIGGASSPNIGGAFSPNVSSLNTYMLDGGRAGPAQHSVLSDFTMSPTTAPDPESDDQFVDHGVNGFEMVHEDPLSTFSLDVDTASYTLARRLLRQKQRPPQAAIRVEEFVNYFDYDYPQPEGPHPLTVVTEAFPDPFRQGRHILRVGFQAKTLPPAERPPLHLTFLVDVSGSMESADKLQLAQKALHMLVDVLQEGDTVALATYAGRTTEILQPTDASNKREIHDAIAQLSAGGSTAMSSGIDIAYQLALRSFEEGAENRVLILSDGDANVGTLSWEDMVAQIKDKADMGVTLSTVGFGTGNYHDNLMEQLANNGDGSSFYVDSLAEAQRLFVEDMAGTLYTVARDVKLQLAFHGDTVLAYRLIGYENRDIADKDFRDDRVDAGEVGAGHSVTALYELILREGYGPAIADVHVRYEAPGADKAASEVRFQVLTEALHERSEAASDDAQLAYTAATFAELLRGSPHTAEMSLPELLRYADSGHRDNAERQELMKQIRRAKRLSDSLVSTP